jgi:hypothetical protein
MQVLAVLAMIVAVSFVVNLVITPAGDPFIYQVGVASTTTIGGIAFLLGMRMRK